MSHHPILDGLNGWHRWSSWAAHHFVDGEQSCDTKHGNYMGGDFEPKRPNPAELAPSGQPYGKVCSRCLKSVRAANEARPNVVIAKGPRSRFFVGSGT